MLSLDHMKSSRTPKTWIFFFVIVLVLIVAALLQPAAKSQVKSPPSKTAIDQALPASREANATSMLKDGDNAIFVTDQSSSSSKIQIGYVILGKPGFITVRDDDHGMPGKIIGVSQILSGHVDAPSVDVSTKLEEDHVYYAELVTDDGNGTFEEAKDHPADTKDKSVVLMSFLAKTSAVSTAQ